MNKINTNKFFLHFFSLGVNFFLVTPVQVPPATPHEVCLYDG